MSLTGDAAIHSDPANTMSRATCAGPMPARPAAGARPEGPGCRSSGSSPAGRSERATGSSRVIGSSNCTPAVRRARGPRAAPGPSGGVAVAGDAGRGADGGAGLAEGALDERAQAEHDADDDGGDGSDHEAVLDRRGAAVAGLAAHLAEVREHLGVSLRDFCPGERHVLSLV